MSAVKPRRPGPLQELPLERFLTIPPQSPSKKKSNKRPLSPSEISLFSPTKRRILEQEGVFSPTKSFKSPFRIPSSAASARHALFAGALEGPDSPAKKLVFGLPKNSPQAGSSSSSRSQLPPAFPEDEDASGTGPNTPSRSADKSPTLVASPEGKALPRVSSSSSRISDDEDVEGDYFSSRPVTCMTALPMMIPREMPPAQDRQSADYPGFDIHIDTHIPLLRASSASSSSSSSTGLTGSSEDDDAPKENVPARRRAKKALTAPADPVKVVTPGGPSPVCTPHGAATTPATPRKGDMPLGATERPGTPTPRRPGLMPRLTELQLVAGSGSGGAATPAEKRVRKQAMLDETDDYGDEDEVEEEL